MRQIIVGTIVSFLTAVFAVSSLPYTVQSTPGSIQPTPTRLTGPECGGRGTVQALARRNLRSEAKLGDAFLFTPRRFLEPSAKAESVVKDSTCKFYLLRGGEWVYDEGLVFTPAQVPTGTPLRPTATPTRTNTPIATATATSAPVFLRIRVNGADLGIIEAIEGEPIVFSVERVSR